MEIDWQKNYAGERMRKGSEEEEERKINRDEVEELIQAAQDQLLLQLHVNSHIASASVSSSSETYLDSDLERRFEALKSRRSTVASAREDHESKAAFGDDLSARFAALKARSNPSSSSTPADAKQTPLVPAVSVAEDENEDDEVERLIQWAKDAARLDPSPPSDDDEVEEEQDDDDEENNSEEEKQYRRKPK